MDFGDFCLIEQHRYGADNEMYLHKVINRLRSNSYVTVPVDGGKTDTTEVRGEMADVVSCICCGVQETEVRKYRVEDVKPNDKFKESGRVNFNEDRVLQRQELK